MYVVSEALFDKTQWALNRFTWTLKEALRVLHKVYIYQKVAALMDFRDKLCLLNSSVNISAFTFSSPFLYTKKID